MAKGPEVMNAMVFPTAAFGRTYSRQNKGRSSNGSSVVGSKNDIVAGGVSAETTVALQLNRRGRLVLLGHHPCSGSDVCFPRVCVRVDGGSGARLGGVPGRGHGRLRQDGDSSPG